LLTCKTKIPHAFQDILGTEKTPSLPYTIRAFFAFIQRWKELEKSNVRWREIIKPGLEKLETYEEELEHTSAYVLAMGKLNIFHYQYPLRKS